MEARGNGFQDAIGISFSGGSQDVGFFTIKNGGAPSTITASSVTIQQGQWYHVVAQRDINDTYRLYIDGRLEAEDHKTVKQYGVSSETIPPSLYDLIENWMNLMGLQEGDWLLPNPRDSTTHMSQASFSQYMAKEFKTGVQMLRNIFVSEYLDQRSKDVAEGRMSNGEF